MVPATGLEPVRCYSLEPESSASANSATRAQPSGQFNYAESSTGASHFPFQPSMLSSNCNQDSHFGTKCPLDAGVPARDEWKFT